MQTHLAPQYADTSDGKVAESILRKCVHCGFCTATCPTYQLLGDELDGPRGRIYLIKQVLEGQTPTRATQLHLDRCLTCRNCESTCPSGVEYGHLVDIGRQLVDAQVPRPPAEAALRWSLKEGMNSAAFAPAMKLGQALRGFLPQALQAKVPVPQAAGRWPTGMHARKVLLLRGCVQPAMLPNIDAATARVLDAAGVQSLMANGQTCCGAVKFHLNDHEGGKAQMRANIDAWWPFIAGGNGSHGGQVEAIVMNASGCGSMVKDYGHVLRDDPAYAAKAARVSELCRDLAELLPDLVDALKPKLQPTSSAPAAAPNKVVFHPPCSLQHGQKVRGAVESALTQLGAELQPITHESHLCCGSAGTYSVLQPQLATQLRDRKLGHLQASGAQVVLSANIGCITHLQGGTATPVRHWVEWLDGRLVA